MDALKPSSLVDDSGVEYVAFRRTLRPRWWRVGVDLGFGYAMLLATAFLLTRMDRASAGWLTLAIAGAAISFGYWMAYLQLFLHEAAHFNLAPSRGWNDRLADVFIASWVGTSIANYRAIHWQHHRFHGETLDTERSYFSALDARFVLEGLTGVSALRVVLFRQTRLECPEPGGQKFRKAAMAVGGLLHGGIVAVAFAAGHWPLALAWTGGIGLCFPFFGALRQLLEHRDETASRAVDYRVTPHGRTTRLFREGPLASTFGAAGFTRHRLHHWDPQVSYTNLAQVETFLRGCAAARSRLDKTTYLRAFGALYGR